MILCEYLVGKGGSSLPTIVLESSVIGDDLDVARTSLVFRHKRVDLILELEDEEGVLVEWVCLVGIPDKVNELLLAGQVLNVINGQRVIGIVNPHRGREQPNGEVKYA